MSERRIALQMSFLGVFWSWRSAGPLVFASRRREYQGSCDRFRRTRASSRRRYYDLTVLNYRNFVYDSINNTSFAGQYSFAGYPRQRQSMNTNAKRCGLRILSTDSISSEYSLSTQIYRSSANFIFLLTHRSAFNAKCTTQEAKTVIRCLRRGKGI